MWKWLTKIGCVVAITAITVGGIPQAVHGEPAAVQASSSVPSDWAKEDVEKAVKLNLFSENISSAYQENINRQEICEIAIKLYEALSGKSAESKYESPFIDTQNPSIIIANELKIVEGRGEGIFDPYGTATRQEICVILYRALQAAKPEYDLSLRSEYPFSDENDIAPWAKKAVDYLNATGIINGVGNSRFDPKGTTTLEMAIVLSKRMYEKFSVPGNEKIAVRRKDATASRAGDTRSEKLETLKTLIAQAMGKPYRWGATGPDSYDCSGLVYSLYGKLGYKLPRVSSDQATVGKYVAKSDLQFGDLVFFARDGKHINHVGIYIGNGEFVHAPQTGEVVKKTTLLSGYYANTYYTARRVIY